MQSTVPAEYSVIFHATKRPCRPPCENAPNEKLAPYFSRQCAYFALLYIPTTYPMTLTNHKTNKEPNNRCISAPSRQHNWVVPFLQQSQPDTPLSNPHYPQHRSASSNPQLHIPDQTSLRSHLPVREYLQDPSPLTTHFVQDRRSEPPLSRNSVCRALEFVMIRSR